MFGKLERLAPLLEDYVDEELQLLIYMSYIIVVTSAIVFVVLLWISAPYGRYGSSSFGPPLPGKAAWIIQELPAFVVPIVLISFTDAPKLQNTTNCILLGMFLFHYFQRTFIFPCLMRGGKPTPLVPFLLALLFCLINGFLQGRYLTEHAQYDSDWTSRPSFIIGVLMFVTGMMINLHSDHILRNLRKPGETGYKIPHGGLFEYVSGANFFGEIVEWCGFAVASQSLPALAFALFTATNIGPRALSHHRWYKEKFRDAYPRHRKIIIPFVL